MLKLMKVLKDFGCSMAVLIIQSFARCLSSLKGVLETWVSTEKFDTSIDIHILELHVHVPA